MNTKLSHLVKTCLCFFGLLTPCVSLTANGQETYKPMLKDGRVWNCIEVYMGEEKNDTVNCEYRIEGTSEIDRHVCYNLCLGSKQIGTYYEEGPKVFHYTAGGWELLFDFSLSPGDAVPNWGGLVVDEVKTIVIKGESRRCLYSPLTTASGTKVCNIEGIGSSESGPYYYGNIVIGSLLETKLLSVYDGDVCIFEAGDLITNTDVEPVQEYFPEGTKWKEVAAEPHYIPLDTAYSVIWEIGPDTIINNFTYKQVFLNGKTFNIWVREEAGVVWLLTEEYPREILLYNFNWIPDEVLYTEYIRETDNGIEVFRDEFTVNDYKTIKCGNHTYQYMFNNHEYSTIWGIGRVAELNKNCGLLGYSKMKEILPGLIYSKVLWINRNNEEIFRSEIAEEWTCEIPTNINHNGSTTKDKNPLGNLFDLQGRRLSGKPERGIYIEEGKKKVKN